MQQKVPCQGDLGVYITEDLYTFALSNLVDAFNMSKHMME